MGLKPDLDDQLVSFSALDTVGLVIWPVKIVPKMTYYVLSGMLSLYTTISVARSYVRGPNRGSGVGLT